MPLPPEAHRAVDAVWRMESARIVARLVCLVGDVGKAEDFAQDALVAALESWSESGVPDNPGAWLMTVARHRAIDHLRRVQRLEEKHRELEARSGIQEPDSDAALEPVEDEMLRLVFMCCHPVLSREARVALTLRLLGGLTTEEIARAFLASVSTVAQRIVRAKRTLREAQVPFEMPPESELPERLASVLEVIYLVFNEGYAATSGKDWTRPELCRDALRLGRVLAELAPREPEVHGLVSLMETQASRLEARVGPDGAAILLQDQDRARWDRLHIRRGLSALERARELGGVLGPYALQAAIAAGHARAPTAADTDWEAIAALYDALAQVAPSPVVTLNRAVALGMAFGAEAGLELVKELESAGELEGYHLLPAVRAHLLHASGRVEEARAEFLRAASLTKNEREREVLLARAEGEREEP